MPTYNFRILIETKQGKEFSYISQSFFNSAINPNYAISSSDAWNRITGSLSCSFQNIFNFSGSNPGSNFNQDFRFKDNIYLSSSLKSGLDTGSIQFYTNGDTGSDGDSLRRFKFIGEKVCTALGLPHDLWQFTNEFRLVKGSERHYFRGDVVADSLHVVNNMAISNLGNMDSDLPFRIDKESDRYIKFVKASSSISPHNDLLFGYNDELNQYWLSASDHPVSADDAVIFNIGGVNNISASGVIQGNRFYQSTNGAYLVPASISQSFWITSSAENTLYRDVGNVAIGTTLAPKTLTVGGDISASGHLWLKSARFIKYNDNNYIGMSTAYDSILYNTNKAMHRFIGASVGIGVPLTTATIPKTLTVQGDISASGNLSVEGNITASGNISASGAVYGSTFYDLGVEFGADYVFEPEYVLRTLPEVEEHIEEHQHLPGMPSVDDINGWKQLSIGDRDMKLLEKIEELTLYIIDLHKRIEKLEKT